VIGSPQTRLRVTSLSMMLVVASGCGGKGTTRLAYQPHGAPIQITFQSNKDGSWTVGGGIVTPVGTFLIEHTTAARDEFTYIVMRDRKKGTDEVFKIGNTGYVEVHTVGEHKLRVYRDGNRVIIDTETINGSITVNVYPSSTALARADFGPEAPDVIVTSDAKLIVEHPSIWRRNQHVPLASVKAIELQRQVLSSHYRLRVEWKDGIKAEPLDISFGSSDSADTEFQTMKAGIAKVAPHVLVRQGRTWWRGAVALAVIIVVVLLILSRSNLISGGPSAREE